MLAIGLLACWVASHFANHLARGRLLPNQLVLPLRIALASATLWAAFQALGRAVYLATPWPLWLTACLSGLAIELAILLYQHERRIVGSGRARLLISLRVAALLTLSLILLQPLLAVENRRRLPREIVVLLDDSSSMHLADQQLTPTEKLKLAALLGIHSAARGESLTEVQRSLQLLDSQLAAEAGSLAPPSGVSETAADLLISRQASDLGPLLESASEQMRGVAAIVKQKRGTLSGQAARPLEAIEDRIEGNIIGGLNSAKRRLADGEFGAVSADLEGCRRQISYVLDELPPILQQLDDEYYRSLKQSERAAIDSTAELTRSAIARQALLHGQFIEQLGSDYQLRFVRFARSNEEFDGTSWLDSKKLPATSRGAGGFRASTDLTTALEFALENIPAGKLAGILLLSDGRHNGERPVDDVVRRLGLQGTPLCSIAIGSSLGPRDAGILGVRVPETIYLDDRAMIQADLKLDGLEGVTVTASLFDGDQFLESSDIEVGSNSLRTMVRFAHTPDEIGISKLSIELSLSQGEAFLDNNRWEVEVAVTDDRTNVLIVESYPRWEFRYLRNLFHARDRSVNLQYLLTNPDQIADGLPIEEVPASADRRFGDSEATALPVDRDEWLKFDAIILGDIAPETIDEATWEHIQHCVADRAALLVTIAGPRSMPHAFSSPIFKELLPIAYAESTEPVLDGPEPSYQLRLTPAGRLSPIMQQSPDPNLNDLVWSGLPSLHWRHPIANLKAGAEVLAYAQPSGGSENRSPSLEFQEANALIVAQRYGSGKVLALNFDRSWRLRYGVGDIYHHKFWGQILRWGTGEILRAGNEILRLGTDQLSYEPGAEIRITAQVNSTEYRPTPPAGITANISYQGRSVIATKLTLIPDSNGTYETVVQPALEPGRYDLRVELDRSSPPGTARDAGTVATEFLVGPNQNEIEFSELSADRAFLGRVAALSGGSVADPDNAASLKRFFSPPGQIVSERKETTLWDNFPILLIFLALLTSEWITRRKSGLA